MFEEVANEYPIYAALSPKNLMTKKCTPATAPDSVSFDREDQEGKKSEMKVKTFNPDAVLTSEEDSSCSPLISPSRNEKKIHSRNSNNMYNEFLSQSQKLRPPPLLTQ